ncbi:MAG: phycobilisome protein [Geitlerinemataceae cyanobacterium]
MLSERAKTLIDKARIVSFEPWQADCPAAIVRRFQEADDRREYLSRADLAAIAERSSVSPRQTKAANTLRDEAATIVSGARKNMLAAYPDITQPGGALYPEMRAEACWRDLWNFLRCISYGVAGDRRDYISAVGLEYLGQLYEELHVPLDAMTCGIANLKTCALPLFDADTQAAIGTYFDYIAESMQRLKDLQARSV